MPTNKNKNSDYDLVAYDKDQKNFVPVKVSKIAFSVFLVFVGFALVALWPFAFIWALNTLFNLTIPYSFWTWLSCVILMSSVAIRAPSASVSKNVVYQNSKDDLDRD